MNCCNPDTPVGISDHPALQSTGKRPTTKYRGESTDLMKKIFSVLTAGLLLSGTLTACGNSSAANESSAELAAVDLVQSDGSAKITVANGQFQVGGQRIWMCGTNTPWDNWDDFGREFDYKFWDEHFAALHEAGINSSRVWILCSGDYGIQFDENGYVTGMTDQFWNDVNQLMYIAAEHKIYIMATMMSFDCCKNGNRNNKKFRAMIQDDALTQSYIDNYIIPFAERYDSNDYLFSIDLCNEPDWIHENKEEGQLPWKDLFTFFAKCSAAIHQHSEILVTTGIGYIPNNSDVNGTNYISDEVMKYYGGDDAPMDFYSVHFYDWMIRWYGNPLTMTPEEYGLDTSKPNVMGECSANGSQQDHIDLTAAAQNLYANGWEGIYPWTSTGTDGNGGFAEVTAYSNAMQSQIESLIFPLGKD